MLGVTNPFFAKMLQHWPNIVRVGDVSEQPVVPNHNILAVDAGRYKKTSKLSAIDPKPGVYSKYKPFLKRDRSFLKALAKVGLFVWFFNMH